MVVVIVRRRGFDADVAVGEPRPEVALKPGLGETVASKERPAGVVPAAGVDPGLGEGLAHPFDDFDPKRFRAVKYDWRCCCGWLIEEACPAVVLDQPVDALGVLAFEDGRGVGSLHPSQNSRRVMPPTDGRQQRHGNLVLAGSLASELRSCCPDRSCFR